MHGNIAPVAERCKECLLRSEWCFCAEVPHLKFQTKLTIIRHWKERCRTSNSARLVKQAIPATELMDYGAPQAPFEPSQLNLDGAALLFPSDTPSTVPPKRLIILDGSWPQARKMMRRIPILATLPRVQVQPKTIPPTRIRQPPFRGGMATIEAVARALDLLEGDGAGAELDALFARLADTHYRLRGKIRPPR